MTEVVQVARAEGVKLQKVSGTLDLDWMALTEAERQSLGSPGLVAKYSACRWPWGRGSGAWRR